MSKPKRHSDPIAIQERDVALLRGLFESRVMTSAHARDLYFEGKTEAAKKRLQRLKALKFIGERTRKVSDPSVLFLTRKSINLLSERGILAEYPSISLPTLEKRARVSELTVRHELEVMDVKAAFHSAIPKNQQFSITTFGTWPLLYQFEAQRSGFGGAEILVKPDGFIRIREEEEGGNAFEHAFFLEVDRSTETLDTLVSRAGCYLNFYKSGGFAVRNGGQRSEFTEFPFRVLMVFKTAERRNNVAVRLLQNIPPILTHVYLTTLDEVKAGPFGGIWIRPLDYREAVKGTSFGTGSRKQEWGYKRQTERDSTVEESAEKHYLLL